MGIETELKLAISDADATVIDRQPAVREHKLAAPRLRHLRNIYFDTPDLRLHQVRIGLRLRLQEGRWLQTLKTGGNGNAGLHQRQEWEYEVAGEALDFSPLEDSDMQRLFADPELRAQLQPIFITDFERNLWDLSYADGSQIELVLDQGRVEALGKSQPISELELELKQGSVVHLFDLAQRLAETLPVQLLNVSKAERGYRLISAAPPPTVVVTEAPGLRRKMRLEEALESLLRQSLNDIQSNAAVVLTLPQDTEAIHQLLRAARQLRAGLDIFQPMLAGTFRTGLIRAVDWLIEAVHPVRSWDHFILETLDPLECQFPRHPGLRSLTQGAGEARDRAAQRLRESLSSALYTRLLLALASGIEGRDWRDGLARSQRKGLRRRLDKQASGILRKAEKQLLAQGRALTRCTAEERDQLSLRAKQLQAATLLFGQLYRRKTVRPYLTALQRLIQSLDTLAQEAQAYFLLEHLTLDREHPGVNLVWGWEAGRADQATQTFAERWEGFSAQRRFWRNKH